MSADGSVTFAWGDGEYRFRLGISELRELQDKCATGAGRILERLLDGSWFVDDVREPIRLGLIGGGMDATKALGKIGKYVAPASFRLNRVIAARILNAALYGDETEVGKRLAAAAAAYSAATDDSVSISSSESVPSWDGHPPMSTAARSGNSPLPSMDGIGPTAATSNEPSQ